MKDKIENAGLAKQIRLVGPIVRTAVGDAIKIIQKQAVDFVPKAKIHYSGADDDLVTTADYAAQAFYLEVFEHHFPQFGIVGEENGLRKPCTVPSACGDSIGENIYFTVDPLDGTKAFARRQSYGVGTMVGLVQNGQVIASFIGDVNTGEIYSFAPGDVFPTRERFKKVTDLVPCNQQNFGPLAKRYALLNEAPWRMPKILQHIVKKNNDEGGLFKNVEVNYGSYGTLFARLWKGEVAAIITDPSYTTPWDEVPVIGMNKALGFVSIALDTENKTIRLYDIPIVSEPTPQPYYILTVHQDYLSEFMDWFNVQASKYGYCLK